MMRGESEPEMDDRRKKETELFQDIFTDTKFLNLSASRDMHAHAGTRKNHKMQI